MNNFSIVDVCKLRLSRLLYRCDGLALSDVKKIGLYDDYKILDGSVFITKRTVSLEKGRGRPEVIVMMTPFTKTLCNIWYSSEDNFDLFVEMCGEYFDALQKSGNIPEWLEMEDV